MKMEAEDRRRYKETDPISKYSRKGIERTARREEKTKGASVT